MHPILAWLGWWEITAVCVIVLILFWSTRLPNIARGLRQGIEEFGKTIGEASSDNEKESGLVYEALTQDNRTAEFVYPHKLDFSPVSTVILFIAQGFGVGRIPFVPGTFGSIVGLLWFALLLLPGSFWVFLGGAIAAILVSVWVCGAAERLLQRRDPPSVVLDEIIAVPFCFLVWVAASFFRDGQMPSPRFFFGPDNWLLTLGVFVAFRFFDVIKPWPVRQSQKLAGGWGVTMDDVLAAGYVNLATGAALLIFSR
jgi:phosphatidylglycerophosphatase A